MCFTDNMCNTAASKIKATQRWSKCTPRMFAGCHGDAVSVIAHLFVTNVCAEHMDLHKCHRHCVWCLRPHAVHRQTDAHSNSLLSHSLVCPVHTAASVTDAPRIHPANYGVTTYYKTGPNGKWRERNTRRDQKALERRLKLKYGCSIEMSQTNTTTKWQILAIVFLFFVWVRNKTENKHEPIFGSVPQ